MKRGTRYIKFILCKLLYSCTLFANTYVLLPRNLDPWWTPRMVPSLHRKYQYFYTFPRATFWGHISDNHVGVHVVRLRFNEFPSACLIADVEEAGEKIFVDPKSKGLAQF